jgi:hypothetical protein
LHKIFGEDFMKIIWHHKLGDTCTIKN